MNKKMIYLEREHFSSLQNDIMFLGLMICRSMFSVFQIIRHSKYCLRSFKRLTEDVSLMPIFSIKFNSFYQIMSNDKYKSVEHRVVMNSHEEARVSSAIFYNPGKRGDSVFYGPLPELVSSENPPKYRNFTMPEFLGTFFKRELASNALIEHFKI